MVYSHSLCPTIIWPARLLLEILHNHTGVTGGTSCARSWLYEAVLAPMAVRLKTEIAKVPALEFLVNPGGGQVESAVTVRTALSMPKHTWQARKSLCAQQLSVLQLCSLLQAI